MMALIKNELYKIFSGKIFPIFLGIILLFYALPIIESLTGLKSNPFLSGQTLALTILGPLVTNLLPLFIILMMSRMIVEEYVGGMLTVSLIQPISRTKLLTAKLLALMVPLFLFLLFTILSGYLIGTLLFGWGDFILQGKTYTTGAGILLTWGSYLLTLFPLIAFAAFVLLLSLQFNSSGVAVGVLFGLLLSMSVLGQLIPVLQPVLIVFQLASISSILINPQSELILSGLFIISLYGIGSYLLSLYLFKRRDILY